MNTLFRRYEILLPRQLNDELPVSDTLISDTFLELRQQFGAAFSQTRIIPKGGMYQGQSHRGELVFVDVPDTSETQLFFREFKERLKERFRQIDIWITSHPIEII